MRRARILFLLLAPCSLLPGGEPAAPAPAAAPAINWVLPLFNRDGFRSMTLRGSEARGSTDHIIVTDLSITRFSGDAMARVDSVLLSPSASFFPKTKKAHGDGPVRLIHGDTQVSGIGWDYDHDAERVFIRRDVRVVIPAQLNDVLK